MQVSEQGVDFQPRHPAVVLPEGAPQPVEGSVGLVSGGVDNRDVVGHTIGMLLLGKCQGVVGQHLGQ